MSSMSSKPPGVAGQPAASLLFPLLRAGPRPASPPLSSPCLLPPKSTWGPTPALHSVPCWEALPHAGGNLSKARGGQRHNCPSQVSPDPREDLNRPLHTSPVPGQATRVSAVSTSERVAPGAPP